MNKPLDVYITSKGEEIAFCDMNDFHLVNAMKKTKNEGDYLSPLMVQEVQKRELMMRTDLQEYKDYAQDWAQKEKRTDV